MSEKEIDQQLHIHTTEIIQYYSDDFHHRYEPTPYSVLDKIIELNLIDKNDIVLDYGCGLGRVDFYLHHKLGCQCIGIEYNYDIYQQALTNLKHYKSSLINVIKLRLT